MTAMKDHTIERATDKYVANGRIFYSVQWLARILDVEAGTLSRLLVHQATWPVPFFQAKPKDPYYIEKHNVERIREANEILQARAVKKRTARPDAAANDGVWARELRLELLKMKLWRADEIAARGQQTRSGRRKLVTNPPLRLPDESDGPTLFDDVSAADPPIVSATVTSSFTLPLTKSWVGDVLRHCEAFRVSGWRTASQQRKKLLERQRNRCEVCRSERALLKDNEKETVVDHMYNIRDAVADVVLRGKPIMEVGFAVWLPTNLRAVHRECNQRIYRLAVDHEKREKDTASV